MKIPSNITGKALVKCLNSLGYKMTRQVGSHMRLSTQIKGTHHVTVPNNNPIKVGTLSAILNKIADHHEIPKAKLIEQLFLSKK